MEGGSVVYLIHFRVIAIINIFVVLYLLYIVFSLKYILLYIVEEFIYTRITEVFDTIINSLF